MLKTDYYRLIYELFNIKAMPKQIIKVMDERYPFGECEECSNQNTRVLIRKTYQLKLFNRKKILEKVSILRNLKNENMIKIESVLEEE